MKNAVVIVGSKLSVCEVLVFYSYYLIILAVSKIRFVCKRNKALAVIEGGHNGINAEGRNWARSLKF